MRVSRNITTLFSGDNLVGFVLVDSRNVSRRNWSRTLLAAPQEMHGERARMIRERLSGRLFITGIEKTLAGR